MHSKFRHNAGNGFSRSPTETPLMRDAPLQTAAAFLFSLVWPFPYYNIWYIEEAAMDPNKKQIPQSIDYYDELVN